MKRHLFPDVFTILHFHPTLPCATLSLSALCLCLYLKSHLHALMLRLIPYLCFSVSSLSPTLRPLQPGCVGGRHVRPAAARSSAPRSHPDPEAAGGGGCLRRLQHRTQRAQLLPACMFAHNRTINVDWTHERLCKMPCHDWLKCITSLTPYSLQMGVGTLCARPSCIKNRWIYKKTLQNPFLELF